MFCLIGSDTLKIPRHQRTGVNQRTLEGIEADYTRFQANGGEAKHYNNVIGAHFLDVDLDQVSKS